MIIYNSKFKKLVDYSFEKSQQNYLDGNNNPNPYYLGFGNPNAKLLIVGQEKAIDSNNQKQIKSESIENPIQWKKFVDENIQDPKYQYYENSTFVNPYQPYSEKAKGNKTGSTWFYYQKLVSMIYPNHDKSVLGNPFFDRAFITELNHEVSKKKIGYRPNIEREKLWSFDFYKGFSNILLSVGNYINVDDVERLFDVKFIEDKSEPYQKLIVFKNEKTDKILIQTRQLSSGVSNKLLKNIVNKFIR